MKLGDLNEEPPGERLGAVDSTNLAQINDDAVRSLAWCIGAPGLMAPLPGLHFPSDSSARHALAQAWDWLSELDHNPAPLHAQLAATRSWKVGLYFESLLAEWFRWHSQYDLLAQNLQVRDETRTLGAFDFVLRHGTGQAQHWEVAVKFYLQRQASEDWTAWVGPNQRDRLDIKLERMRHHQLPLSARLEAANALASIHIAEPPEQIALLKGMFFVPWNAPSLRPRGCAPETPVGQWITTSDFAAFSETQPPCRWCVREKPDWLGPARRTRDGSSSTADALVRLKANGARRPQLWSRLVEHERDIWFEDHRIFVVPDSWPR
jgi:hypothetical protein